MIKMYRKTTTTQAEQFDGSNEMIKRYSLDYLSEKMEMFDITVTGCMTY